MAAARVPLVAGNWKMNPTSQDAAVALAEKVAAGVEGLAARSLVCPPC